MQYIQKKQKYLALMVCIFFCAILLPSSLAHGAEYSPHVTKVTANYFTDLDNRQTSSAGEVHQFCFVFSATSAEEQVIISLPSSIPVLSMTAQPDNAKIAKIVSGKATTKIYLKKGFDIGEFYIRFAEPITTSGEYVITAAVEGDATPINANNRTNFIVDPDEAVIISPQISSELLQKSYLRSDVDVPVYDVPPEGEIGETYVNFKGTIRLYLKDQYNNPTNKLPNGYDLYMKFDSNNRGSYSDYDMVLANGVKVGGQNYLTESYQPVSHIPNDSANLGQIEIKLEYTEVANSAGTAPNVPRVYAALVYKSNGQIDSNREIFTSVGFLEDNVRDSYQQPPKVYLTGDISLGSSSNVIYITIEGTYPAAGRQVVLELPKGFVNIETQSNKVYFDYDDIGKTKTVVLTDLPTKVKTPYTQKDIGLGWGNKQDKKIEEFDAIELFSELIVIPGPATNGSKGSTIEQADKKAPEVKANGVDAIEMIAFMRDTIGQISKKFDSSYSLYIWAEREEGKVSTDDFILSSKEAELVATFVNTGEKDANGIPLYEDNGINGIYRCETRNLPDNGEIPFAVASLLDGKVEIKAAIATSAYYALYMEEGRLKKSVKLNFEPYAEESGWKFTEVAVKSLKEEYLQSSGKPHHTTYTVMQTKKADGVDTFSVTAMLSPWSGEIKLGSEPITISTSSPDLKITGKDKSTEPLEEGNGIHTITASSGKFSFDLATNKIGTYKIIVQADNATWKDGERSGYMEFNVTFDEEGGNIIPSGDPESDLAAKLQSVTTVVLEEQSSFLLAPTDNLYALFKLYDKNKKQVILDDDEEALAAIKNLRFTTKPTESILENNTNSVKVTEDDGGICLTFVADQRGAYTLEMTLINEKTGKVSFNVDQMNKIIGMELSYPETGLPLGGTSGTGILTFIDSGGKRIEQALPMEGIRLSASGIPLEQFSKETSVVKARTGDSYSGEIITVKAYDRTRNLTAYHDFVVAHEIITLEFDQTKGELLRDLITNLTMKDSNGRTLPANSLLYDDGGRVRVTVVSKPANAVINTELVNNGKDFIDLGNNDLKVRSDRIGDVRIRVDVRAIDPHYSQKYPVYAYLTGVANYNFVYPGILESKPLVEGYDNADATLMYIGSQTYVSRGEIKVMDAAPFIENSRTFIPVRALADSLGTTVYYNSENQRIYLSNNKDTIVMQIGVPVLTSREKGQMATDVAPFIVDGRTYLPVRAISEALDCNVDAVYEGNNIAGVIFAPRK